MDECAWRPFDLGEEGVVLFGPPGTDGLIVVVTSLGRCGLLVHGFFSCLLKVI
jgi:hypothetical protein